MEEEVFGTLYDAIDNDTPVCIRTDRVVLQRVYVAAMYRGSHGCMKANLAASLFGDPIATVYLGAVLSVEAVA